MLHPHSRRDNNLYQPFSVLILVHALITEKAGFSFFRKDERMEDLGHQPEVLGGLALSESDLSLMNLHQVRNQLECSRLQESSKKRVAYRIRCLFILRYFIYNFLKFF
jgi:hypothetical protein